MRSRFIQDPDTGKLIPAEEYGYGGTMIMPDIEPYQSQMTGEMIESRSQHREHLKRYNLTEIGTEKITAKPRVIPPSPQRKALIAGMVDHFGEDRIRKDAKALGEHLRWNTRKN